MNYPQESHCDLGLNPDADHTPLLHAKALDHQLAGNGSRANDHTPTKEQDTMKTTATTPATPTVNLGQLEGWDVGARLTVEDDEGSPIEVVAILDREPGEVTVRELWIQRTDFLPFNARFGSPEDWREFAAAVNAVVAFLDADILDEKVS
ncbi:hypothetical protein [Tsukamurella pseudospumae]|uniref:Uncharacterized protein n=1 Tax=Tsukamurella pseudospumae TaxID=239498 RepID=A0A138AML4_9ACTN|nr:hypothetical protein [Tsukamurella pseudospumae]KXP11680.1 hypothetical protein AXK60_24590 [Tsukamurella pseudospumae]